MEPGPDLSHRILQAARQLFFARGFSKTQLRTIASEAGTSESGILRIYESKTLLLRAVCDSCWAEVNTELDRYLAEAAKRDGDPRNLLLELMRTVLGFALTNQPLMSFLHSHFASPEALGPLSSGGGPGSTITGPGSEFRRYMERIETLAAGVLEKNPAFRSAGVTALALTHFVQSAIYGIQAGWFISDQEQEPKSPKVSVEEGVACLRTFLYQNAAG